MNQEYRGPGFIVRYDANMCTHAANCVRGLPAVFDATRTPWIVLTGAKLDDVRRQVGECPSGALSLQVES